ncbi:AI-2E family transporter [Actinomadura sp. NPDC048032]|uniref:AI-2E family transporter n=1 Tax=Actinomadura sp. NPDC048032 TaxID=3155747 RepID=UPI0033E89B2C
MPQTPGEPPGATPAHEPAADPPHDPAADHDAEPAAQRSRQMPPWLPRAFALAGGSVLAFLAGLWLLERLRGLLLLLLISLFLAFAIEPAVNWLAARGWRRGVATAAMFAVVGLLLAGFLGGIGSLLAAQANHLISGFPGYVRRFVGWVNATFGTHLSQRTVFQRLPTVTDALSRHLSDLAANVWGFGTTAVGVVFNALGVLLFTFYLSAEGPRFRRTVCSLLPPRRQREVLRAWEIAVDKTGGYIYSRGLLALISGIAHYAAMAGLGVPYAAALALWVGVVSQFIPAVGTYLAGAVPVLIALTKSPSTALWLLLFIIAYQQFENYLLQPRITARTLDMHPAVAFGLILAGAAVAGPIGVLLAIPLGASLQAFTAAYVRRYEVEEHPLTKPDAPPGRWWRWLRR